MFTLNQLLKTMVTQEATDLLLTAGSVPIYRIQKYLVKVKSDVLKPEDILTLMESIMSEEQMKNFYQKKELNFSFGIVGLARFRAHFYFQRGSIAAVFRKIPFEITHLDQFPFSNILKETVKQNNGILIITGPSASGKSYVSASLIDYINQTEHKHIITIEDPIEFIHKHQHCLIDQKEVGVDSLNWMDAVSSVKRADPDIVYVSDIRNQEIYEECAQLAQSGVHVIGSFSAQSLIEAKNKIDFFQEDHYPSSNLKIKNKIVKTYLCLHIIPSELNSNMNIAYEFEGMNPSLTVTLEETLNDLIKNKHISSLDKKKYLGNL